MVGDRKRPAKKAKARKSRAGSAKGPLKGTQEAPKPKVKKRLTGTATKESRVHALPVRQATYSGVAIGKEHTEFPEVAFVGRSNVGKSSLLNAVVGQTKLARVSKTPGATRQIHLFRIELTDGSIWTIADLPGYGFAVRSKDERSQWADDIQKYFFDRPNLRGVCVLAMVTDAESITRYLRSLGEPTELPHAAPARGPPYWQSRVLRR
ncbi:MAG: 50S ribosome-binding GTPase, partial [Polyangiaceae bacterium]|nr:50S ribosome-binding GTPase [Polyangiaceae bacterium]